MTDSKSKLTEEQAMALLQKLATDDDFRGRFEKQPALALTEIGLAAATIIRLDGCCLHLRELAPKSVFKDAIDRLDQNVLSQALAMYIPELRIRG